MKKSKIVFRTEKIGEVEIDTGTLVIVDPCRIDEVVGVFVDGQVCGKSYKDGRQRKTAVMSSTGLGDGRYPVYARTMTTPEFGKRVIQVVIDLDFNYCFADDPKVKKVIAKREKEFLKFENS